MEYSYKTVKAAQIEHILRNTGNIEKFCKYLEDNGELLRYMRKLDNGLYSIANRNIIIDRYKLWVRLSKHLIHTKYYGFGGAFRVDDYLGSYRVAPPVPPYCEYLISKQRVIIRTPYAILDSFDFPRKFTLNTQGINSYQMRPYHGRT